MKINIKIVIPVLIITVISLITSIFIFISTNSKEESLEEDSEAGASENKEEKLDYKILYNQDDFQIREAQLSNNKDTNSINSRLTCEDFKSFDCGWEKTGRTLTAEMPEMICEINSGKDAYTITGPSGGGNYILKKNNVKIWERDLGISPSISEIYAIRLIEEDVVIGFYDIAEQYKSILINGNDILSFINYDSAIAPNDVFGKLVFIATENDRWFIIYDNNKIGPTYDEIVFEDVSYQCLATPESSRSIIGNGSFIDFFARKEDNWYHVQAGDLSELE